ncbi:MAG: OmpA family protein, partial [Gammaproteobacteria bacterium]|nr:OmpA family protein [Gammaproteobacteria bacterium]
MPPTDISSSTAVPAARSVHILAVAVMGSTAALLMSACATTPPHSDEVDQARAEIRTLAQDPFAQSAAAQDLQAAQDRLRDAESALQAREPLDVVDHLAYLARRHAEAGEARVSEAHSRAAVAHAQDERNRILLAKRNLEAEHARSQARSAQEQARSAQEQARSAQEQARSAQQQAQSAQDQLNDAQRELADMKARSSDRGMVVTLGDVLFDTGRATLKPGADLSLDRLARYLTSHPGTRVRVEGHTDSLGSAEYNQQLSEQRADAVAHALTS